MFHLWCSLVTRTISLKSSEGQSAEAKKAIAKEKLGFAKRTTYDLDTVRSYQDWIKGPDIEEPIIGRI